MTPALAQLDFATLWRLCPTLDSLEGDVVAVAVLADGQADLRPGLERLGERLLSHRLGALESLAPEPETCFLWAFYNCPNAAVALPRVQLALREAGLLESARILFARPAANACEQYWPGAPAGTENLAFLQNFSPAWFARAEKIGLEFLLVTFAAPLGSPIYEHPEIERALGLELQAAGAGCYDSSLCRDGVQYHIFHVSRLPVALNVLKQQLALRGLLPITRILHRDTANAWRCFVSPDERELAQLVEDSA